MITAQLSFYGLILTAVMLVSIQAGINFLLVYFLPTRYFTIYKYFSYFVFICIALTPLVSVFLIGFLSLSRYGTPDPAAMSINGNFLIYGSTFSFVMISFQIVFNQIILKRIALKRNR